MYGLFTFQHIVMLFEKATCIEEHVPFLLVLIEVFGLQSIYLEKRFPQYNQFVKHFLKRFIVLGPCYVVSTCMR